jgi:hypothetical protein
MKHNFTRIAIVLDRSGSMESCKESTVTGFNDFIRSQKKIPGEAMVKLVQFDDQYETVFDKPLKDCPELTQNTFVPRGSTALLDGSLRRSRKMIARPRSSWSRSPTAWRTQARTTTSKRSAK